MGTNIHPRLHLRLHSSIAERSKEHLRTYHFPIIALKRGSRALHLQSNTTTPQNNQYKVLLTMNEYVEEREAHLLSILKKMAPPLVTLLSAEPEIQYVALRNINIITQK